MIQYNLYKKFGPIISDDESEIIYDDIKELLSKDNIIIIDFQKVIAMSTKSAKRIFGNLYTSLGDNKFYDKIRIKNSSNTLQEIIYDSIINFISNIEIK